MILSNEKKNMETVGGSWGSVYLAQKSLVHCPIIRILTRCLLQSGFYLWAWTSDASTRTHELCGSSTEKHLGGPLLILLGTWWASNSAYNLQGTSGRAIDIQPSLDLRQESGVLLMFDNLHCHQMMAQSCYTQQPSATTNPASKQPRSHRPPSVLSCLEEVLPHGVHQGFVVPRLYTRWSWLEWEVNPYLALLENAFVWKNHPKDLMVYHQPKLTRLVGMVISLEKKSKNRSGRASGCQTGYPYPYLGFAGIGQGSNLRTDFNWVITNARIPFQPARNPATKVSQLPHSSEWFQQNHHFYSVVRSPRVVIAMFRSSQSGAKTVPRCHCKASCWESYGSTRHRRLWAERPVE